MKGRRETKATREQVSSLQQKDFSSVGGSIRGQSSHQRVPETDKFKVRIEHEK